MSKNKRGQSTLEYVIILSAIVAAIIAGRAMVNTSVNNSLTQTTAAMDSATNRITQLSD